ncbi:rRNA maturation RNase YbeY [Acetonema longum]|uniref:Endoribonuclease YbeY n=1 Tax=Acetonema longum DSM 6540 TaxID=1009370 RepID=F7NKX9_9FIRM|nr:rRNA maturation RNase YbeY [Acetonema longum]EGO63322.1 putative metalloprotease [Acetonema longum DSM 6540]
MEIIISSFDDSPVPASVTKVISSVLAMAAEVYQLTPGHEVSVTLADNQYIQELNREYRGKDRPTDVLSFALNEGDEPEILAGPDGIATLLGDIIISLEMAESQAREYGHSLERELAYLTVHGMLHLLGYDHEEAAEKILMRQEEESILSRLDIVRQE